MRRRAFLALTAAGGLTAGLVPEPGLAAGPRIYNSQKARFRVVQLAGGLASPWGLAFLPTGELLVTENDSGRLRVVRNGTLERKAVAGVPEEVRRRGLHDVAVHPGFAANRLVFLTYVSGSGGDQTTTVARATLTGRRLSGWRVLFRAQPGAPHGNHHGNRVVVDGNGFLYLAIGDRQTAERAQRLDDHAGKIIRLRDDGSVPADNPFVGTAGARPEIWTLGHRNPQGLALRPGTGQLWQAEHGPTGGDEVNRIEPGRNYGWPRATFGTNPDGSPIGEGPLQPGLTPPAHWWQALSLSPPASVAPSGMGFYNGDRFPGWRGNLFVAMLRGMYLSRLELDGSGAVVHEEQLIKSRFGRLRAVRQGPDGLLYVITDGNPGRLLRLEPA